jgi:hypothetical protein
VTSSSLPDLELEHPYLDPVVPVDETVQPKDSDQAGTRSHDAYATSVFALVIGPVEQA